MGGRGTRIPTTGRDTPPTKFFAKSPFFPMIQTERDEVSGGGRMDGKSELKMAKNVSSESGNTLMVE